ncbi:MAG: response regulator [Bryobacteraceae bacterium]|nr:response regulator [Bryobacteraceae bacterium]
MGKALLPASLTERAISNVLAGLVAEAPDATFEELQRQNSELIETLELLRRREAELGDRQTELRRLNLELEETNRGVVALYAELDEKTLAVKRADELKSRFLSYMSHEFRTPVNAILALSQLLLRHVDGDLSAEQERQIGYIRRAGGELLEMVNDLLDLSKVESGRIEIRKAPMDVGQLFRALRGIMRPLALSDAVVLVFDEPPAGLILQSDETKVTQVLRNLISNALKFTEQGEVRVSCAVASGGNQVLLSVTDTGIGIAPQDRELIFQEFAQIDNKLQRRVKGTGLGLPLSRKLAALLGGDLSVQSVPGEGSTFTLALPMETSAGEAPVPAGRRAESSDAILIIDDEEAARYIARQVFRGTRYRIVEASEGGEGAERARFEQPALILLDLAMPGRNGFDVLDDLKSNPETVHIPVVVHTSRHLSPAEIERLRGRHAAVLPKGGSGRREALQVIRELLAEPELFDQEPEFAEPEGGIP